LKRLTMTLATAGTNPCPEIGPREKGLIALASACFAALVLEPSFLASIALLKEKKALRSTSAMNGDATAQDERDSSQRIQE
jgi:hypothetical protein